MVLLGRNACYSALVKNELVMLIEALELPQHRAEVLALIVVMPTKVH